MSRKCCNYSVPYGNSCGLGYGLGNSLGCGSGCCNFPSFIILILILLQFRGHSCSDNPCGNSGGIVDKGILFIIALYYLSCCNPCGRRY